MSLCSSDCVEYCLTLVDWIIASIVGNEPGTAGCYRRSEWQPLHAACSVCTYTRSTSSDDDLFYDAERLKRLLIDGERAVAVHSLLGSAKLNRLALDAYLRHGPDRIVGHAVNHTRKLPAWNVPRTTTPKRQAT